jgi:trans-aconitate methyltransferase
MCNSPDRLGAFVDVGCGTGRLVVPMAHAYPGRHVYGFDLVAHGHDSSPENMTYVVSDGRTLQIEPSVAMVWSVALFQHLDAETVQSYIGEMGRVLVKGGVAAVQFVEGGAEGDFIHAHSAEDVAGWMREAGLTISTMSRGWLLDEWTWLTARMDHG